MSWVAGFDQFCAGLGDLSYTDLIRAVEQADAHAARAVSGGRRAGHPSPDRCARCVLVRSANSMQR